MHKESLKMIVTGVIAAAIGLLTEGDAGSFIMICGAAITVVSLIIYVLTEEVAEEKGEELEGVR